ncbi:hypothetical protein [Myxococcus landrumensis]|uniref:Lipoprotein n=1 Tax=Myxococcus landrumensis TaxID=2813577 RepID=A0ABX7N5E6_9BACT|nr:hypothetical protein [Myxococcus landrumus]QSQ13950.1 hypothetical protein JY572_37475 [Myxococcus landrumus]
MRRLMWSALVVSGLLAACAHSPAKDEPAEPSAETESPAEQKPSDGEALLVRSNPQPQDPISIESGRVEGSTLVLNVSHGGGCAEHSYALAWDGTFQTNAAAEPVANLVVIHNANGDRCKAIKFAEPRFDLSSLTRALADKSGKGSGSVELVVQGLAEPVRYTF